MKDVGSHAVKTSNYRIGADATSRGLRSVSLLVKDVEGSEHRHEYARSALPDEAFAH